STRSLVLHDSFPLRWHSQNQFFFFAAASPKVSNHGKSQRQKRETTTHPQPADLRVQTTRLKDLQNSLKMSQIAEQLGLSTTHHYGLGQQGLLGIPTPEPVDSWLPLLLQDRRFGEAEPVACAHERALRSLADRLVRAPNPKARSDRGANFQLSIRVARR